MMEEVAVGEPDSPSSPVDDRTVIFATFSGTSVDRVKDFFSICGPTEDMAFNEESVKITFSTPDAAKTAVLLDGTRLGSSEVSVQYWTPEVEKQAAAAQEDTDPTGLWGSLWSITSVVKSGLNSVDNALGVTKGLKQIDENFGISDATKEIAEDLSSGIKSFGTKAQETVKVADEKLVSLVSNALDDSVLQEAPVTDAEVARGNEGDSNSNSNNNNNDDENNVKKNDTTGQQDADVKPLDGSDVVAAAGELGDVANWGDQEL